MIHSWWTCILQIGFALLYFVYLMLPFKETSTFSDQFFFRTILHVLFFYFTYTMSRIQLSTNKKLRDGGYLVMYRALRWPRKGPVTIVTQGSMIIFLICVMNTLPSSTIIVSCRLMAVRIVVGCELTLMSCFNMVYLVHIFRHNIRRPAPDATQLLGNINIEELTLQGDASSVIEKQGEVLEYYKRLTEANRRRISELEDVVDSVDIRDSVEELMKTVNEQKVQLDITKEERDGLQNEVDRLKLDKVKREVYGSRRG